MPKQANQLPSPKVFAPLAIGIFIGAVAVATIALVWNHDSPSRASIPTYSTAMPVASTPTLPLTSGPLMTATTAADPAVTRIAAQFVCSCGTCGEKRLDVCSCETAQRERAFIQNQLRDGRSEAEAADALNQKYGGLKSSRS